LFSYAIVSIGITGIATVTGKAPDGTTLTASLTAGPNSNYLLFLNPNLRAKSYVAGRFALELRTVGGGYHMVPAATSSDLQWAKTAKPTDVSYRLGIANTGLLVSIVPWLPIPKTVPAQTLGTFLGLAEDKIFDFDLTGSFNTAGYAARIPTQLGLSKLNKFRIADGMTGSPSPIQDTIWATYFTIIVSPTTGLVTGTLNIEDSVPSSTQGRPATTVKRAVKLYGVMLQMPSGATKFAHGMLVIPTLIKGGETTTSAFSFSGPVSVDPFIASAVGSAGTYTTVVDLLDNGNPMA